MEGLTKKQIDKIGERSERIKSIKCLNIVI